MKRSIQDYEQEIVNQIMIIELCLNVCKQIPQKPGLGEHFNCYFFNLNMTKAINSLHSLLRPTKDEISVVNYLSDYSKELNEYTDSNIFSQDINLIESKHKNIISNMRHKVTGHLDKKFSHTDFTSAYLLSDKLDELIKLTSELKEKFFRFTNWSLSNDHCSIEEKTKTIIENINLDQDTSL